MNVHPIHNHVLVQLEETPDRTPSGIMLPDRSRDKPNKGTVLAVGPGRYNADGKLLPMVVKVSDKVMIRHMAGVPVDNDNRKIVLVTQDEILATLS